MEQLVKLGFIGCGKHATRGHALNALALPDIFFITAAYDTDSEALSRFCDIAPNIRPMESADELISDLGVDAVIIATPHKFHLELMIKAVEARKHVLCEKPLWVGRHVNVVRELLDEAQRKKLVFTSCHLRRFAPEFVELRWLLPGLGKLGNLLEFNFRFFYHEPSTGWKKEDSLLLDHLNHEVDIMNYLLGCVPFELVKRSDSFDLYEVTGKREDGVRILFFGTRRLKNRIFRNELELVFEKGRVATFSILEDGIVHPKIVITDFDKRNTDKLNTSVVQLVRYSYEDVLTKVMRNFGETILGRSENYLSDEDLIVNNEACNELLSKGDYSYVPLY